MIISMDTIILRTGFETVEHKINFQPKTEPKGKVLAQANHVVQVEELRKNGKGYLIQGSVIRQTSVNSEPYAAKLYIDAERRVVDVSCNCVYNKSKKCKHVAALIYFINNEESLSKTDNEQQWGKPSARQLAKEKYSKGKFFYEMRKRSKKPDSIFKTCNHSESILKLKKPSAIKLICANMNLDKDELAIQDLVAEMVKAVDNNLKIDDCKVCVENFFLFAAEYPVYSTEYELPKHLQDFYDYEIVMSSNDIIKLTCDTLNQSKCKNWFLARKKRISASKNAHYIKCRKTKTIEKLLSEMLSDKKVTTRSTLYGISNEPNARDLYQHMYEVEVVQVGLMPSPFQPWLCASLDGAVVKNGMITNIVEFKCPISCEEKQIVHGDICNVNYLEFRNGSVYLKESHIYYTQCQIQLYISGQNICDLFVWSPLGSCCVPVHRDETFIKRVVLQCESFYFIHYLPEVYKVLKKKSCKNTNFITSQKRKFTGVDILNEM